LPHTDKYLSNSDTICVTGMQFIMSYFDHYEVFINMSTASLLMASKVEHIQLY